MKKQTIIILLSAVALLCISCRDQAYEHSPTWVYHLVFSFKDSEGKDLVKPLADEQWMTDPKQDHWSGEINPVRYLLDVIYSNPPDWYDNTIYNRKAYPGFIPTEHKCIFSACQNSQELPVSPWYLRYYNNTHHIDTWGEEVQDLTFKITCPTIFGDESIHEVVTYWEPGEKPIYTSNAICTKAVFEGKEYLPKKNVNVFHYEFPDTSENKDVEMVYYAIEIVLDK